MTNKIKMHDGIIGALLLASALLAWLVEPRFIGLTALTAVTLVSSASTSFCPVH